MACHYWQMTDTTEQPDPGNPPVMTGHSDGRDVPEQPATNALQTFNLKEAAKLTGLSVSTMRRRRGELAKLGATVTDDGVWSIPITALEAAGLMDATRRKASGEPEPAEQPPAPEDAPVSPSPAPGIAQDHQAEPDALERLRALEVELRDAREQLAEQERQRVEERHRAELAEVRQAAAEQRARAAEVLAEERRQTLEVERRMLTAGPSVYAPSWPTPDPSPAEQPAPPEDAEPEPTPQQEPAAEQPAPAPTDQDAPPRRHWWDPRSW